MSALLLTEVFPPQVGGSGKWLFEVYRRMPARSAVVAAAKHSKAEAFDAAQDLTIRRLKLHFPKWGVLEWQAWRQYWQLQRQLVRLVREQHLEAIHCGRVLPEGWLAWLLKLRLGIPYWIFVHGEELMYGMQSRQLGWMMRRVFRGSEGVIANSFNTAAILQSQWRLPAGKVQVVHPGVAADYFVPAERDAGFREQLGWSGRQVVLTVGRLQKRKGQDMLIRALPRIRERVANVLYAIVGNGEERAALEELAQTSDVSDCVQFLGETGSELLLRCYQQCDLFALPNRTFNGDFEGFGMVLVEAQACGRPVLAGDSGGTRETMEIGETGVIVNCDGPDLLADAVSELLVDQPRRERMGAAARRWAVEQFDWPQLAEQVSEIVGGKIQSPCKQANPVV